MATKKKRKSKAKKATKQHVETSDEVSAAAGKLLAMAKRGDFAFVQPVSKRGGLNFLLSDVTALVVAVAGTAMRQDQHKGRRGK